VHQRQSAHYHFDHCDTIRHGPCLSASRRWILCNIALYKPLYIYILGLVLDFCGWYQPQTHSVFQSYTTLNLIHI